MEFKPRDPKTPLDIDIDNIAYNETYEEDLEYYGLEEIIDPENELSDEAWNVLWADEEEFPEYSDIEDLDDDYHISDIMD
jgi:hypothetical protein